MCRGDGSGEGLGDRLSGLRPHKPPDIRLYADDTFWFRILNVTVKAVFLLFFAPNPF